jgi:hypothetical protein
MLSPESPAEENPYAAPQAALQLANTDGEHWRTPRARTHYFTTAFRITVVLTLIATLWMGIGLLIDSLKHGEWMQFFAIGFLAIYLFMICLAVTMVLCSFVVGMDLILQHLGLRLPPPPPATAAGRFQHVEPDALFFTELANQHHEHTADNNSP